jgi:aminoglycoside phosphotransferase (APT) family kinase protein
MTLTSTPPGIPDAPRLAGWIGESLGGEPAELAGIQLIAGGRSNLTYLSNRREVPGYDDLVARLTATLPPEGDTTLVHGDFRLDNVLVTLSPRLRISAVVDWEMATLGDPLADLGLTLVYWTDAGEEGWLDPEQGAGGASGPGLRTDATTSPGFLTRAEFAAGYARRTGRDVSRIGYYVAFGYFKLAVVLEGIYARYLQHQTVGEGFEQEGLVVPTLVARAHQVLDADD